MIDGPFLKKIVPNCNSGILNKFVIKLIKISEDIAYSLQEGLNQEYVEESLTRRGDGGSIVNYELKDNYQQLIKDATQAYRSYMKLIDHHEFIYDVCRDYPDLLKKTNALGHIDKVFREVVIDRSKTILQGKKDIKELISTIFYNDQFGACYDQILKDWGIIGE